VQPVGGHALAARCVSAGNGHGQIATPEHRQGSGHVLHGGGRRERRLRGRQQALRLGLVGRDQRGTRQQLGHISLHQRIVGKARTGGRTQHRVHHQCHDQPLGPRNSPDLVHPAADHTQVVHTAQQPGLDGLGWQVLRQRGQLGVQQVRADGLHTRHRDRVLRRDGGHRRAAMHTEGGKGFQVGLQASPGAAVGPGDAPDDGPRAGCFF
jgi:hypothetical protein